jgi:hypothetical protein
MATTTFVVVLAVCLMTGRIKVGSSHYLVPYSRNARGESAEVCSGLKGFVFHIFFNNSRY